MMQVVEVHGEHASGREFSANPAMFPLFHNSESPDILMVHITPAERRGFRTFNVDHESPAGDQPSYVRYSGNADRSLS